MNTANGMELTSGFVACIEMKSLVLVVPPGAAAIAQRVVARYVRAVVWC